GRVPLEADDRVVVLAGGVEGFGVRAQGQRTGAVQPGRGPRAAVWVVLRVGDAAPRGEGARARISLEADDRVVVEAGGVDGAPVEAHGHRVGAVEAGRGHSAAVRVIGRIGDAALGAAQRAG